LEQENDAVIFGNDLNFGATKRLSPSVGIAFGTGKANVTN
jgi:hypothetical protein